MQASQLGPYRLIAEIGAGGMGVVYRGVHAESRVQVAVKTVRVANPSVLAMLRREIRALTRLSHPGVVRVLDEGVEDGVPWYAMELLQGRTLAEFRDDSVISVGSDEITISGGLAEVIETRIGASERPAQPRPAVLPAARRPPNPWLAEGLAAIAKLCSTLSFIHGSGIVHRDLKPGNILIRPDGTPVLTDFGLVSHVWGAGGRQMLDAGATRHGTPAYMAPEQIEGHVGDARIDLYALGCILYELVAGRPPFVAPTVHEVLRQHLTAEPLLPSTFVDEVPGELEQLIAWLLAKDPRDRTGYADDVAGVLATLGVPGAEAAPDALRPRAYLYRPQMVGRVAVRDQLHARLHAAANGRGSVVFIAAESGAGKTTLAASIGAAAFPLNVEVVMGVCSAGGSPLHPFRPLLQAIADCCVSEGPESTERLLGPHGRVLGAYEPAVDQVARSIPAASQADIPPDATRDLLLETLTDVLARFAERQPILLILDDLQWADELSLKVVRSLTSDEWRSRGLMILGTYRIEEADPDLKDLAASSMVECIDLAPLEESSVAALAGEMLALREVPGPLAHFLARASGGNPLFVGEYLRAAVAERLLYRESGSWRVSASAEHPPEEAGELLALPVLLRELVARRIEAVAPAARGLLEAAAVLGKEFEPDLLLTTAGVPAPQGLDALADLIERHLLEQTSETRLGFVHDKIREIEYDRLTDERRRTLHRAAGLAMETRWAGTADLPLYYGPLAHHWKVAGDPSKTIEYLEKAGEYALGTSAYVDALTYLKDAVELQATHEIPAPAERLGRWHFLLGDAYRCLDDFGRSREHLQQAVSLFGWPVPSGRAGLTWGVLRELGRQSARRWWSRAPERPLTPTIGDATRAYITLLPVTRVSGDPLLPMYATLRALNLSEQTGSPALRGVGYSLMQILLAAVALPRLAARYDSQVQRELAATTDPAARAGILLFVSVYHLFAAQWTACKVAAGESRRLAADIGLRRIWEEASTILASASAYRVEPAVGIAVYEELRASTRRGVHRPQLWAAVGTAVLEVRRGNLDGARDAVRRGRALPQDQLELADGVLLHATGGLVQLTSGNLDEALANAQRATELLAQVPSYVTEQHAAIVFLMEVYVELWRRAAAAGDRESGTLERAALKTCKQALAVAGRVPFLAPDAAYWLGESEWIRHRPVHAKRQWERALARAQALDMPFIEARAQLALSRIESDSTAAERRQQRAQALLDQLGVSVAMYGVASTA